MHISRVDLNLFVVFETIYKEGGITAASQKLHLSQPAVSHALARLRNLLDDPLFERHGQRMTPTPLARTIIDQVRGAIRAMESTLQKGDHFDPENGTQNFSVAFRDALELTLLPPLIKEIARTSANINVVSTRLDRRTLESDLIDGSLDAAVDILLPISPAIQVEFIMAEPLAVLVRKDHPRIRGALTLEQYLAEGHIQTSARRRGPSLEDMGLSRIGLCRDIRLRCQHFGTACRAVSMSDLIATVPERYARIANTSFDNQILPIPLNDCTLELFLYWHQNSTMDPANRWFRERVFKSAAAAGAVGNGYSPGE